jgi:hypothetical protein
VLDGARRVAAAVATAIAGVDQAAADASPGNRIERDIRRARVTITGSIVLTQPGVL